MDIFKRFATDAAAEINGVVHDLGEGGFVTIARFGNENFNELFNELSEKHRLALNSDDKKAAEEAATKVMIKTLARTVLVGFTGLKYDGEPMAYSVENAEKLLSHRDFSNYVVALSRDVENYRIKKEAEVAKN